MYIDPILFGVMATIIVEIIGLVAYGIWNNKKK